MSETAVLLNKKLPPGWRWVQLGEVCEILAGQSPPGTTYRKVPTGLPFFQGKADFGSRYPVARTWCIAPTKIALPGDILISVRAPVGPTNIASEKCCIGRGLVAIRPGSQADRDFILAALKLYEGRITQLGSGSTFQAIKRDDLESLEIPLPSLAEQKRIVAILNEQMAAVEKARAAAEAQLEAARTLPSAYLRRVFPRQGEESPNGWRQIKLGEICELNPRRPNIQRSDIAPTTFIPMTAVNASGRGIGRPELKPYGQVKKGYTYFGEGDVLFAKITPCMQNGKHAIARNLTDEIAFGSTEFHVIRPGEFIISDWIHQFLIQPWILQEATAYFTGAVGQQRVPENYLADLDIPLPPLDEQKRIVAILHGKRLAAEQLQNNFEEQLNITNKLPMAILRKAFSGEL